MVETARQSIKKIATTVNGYLMLKTGNPAVIEFKNFIKARNEQWEEECRERKRVELEEREAKIEENRREAEAEVREKERIMKQIRRAEMENERMENRDNNNTIDDNDTKNFTTEAKGSKARADNLTTEAKGAKAKADDITTEAKGSKARADDLTTEAKGGKARSEENSSKSEAAQQETIPLKSRRRRQQWSMNKEENFHTQWEERSRAMR